MRFSFPGGLFRTLVIAATAGDVTTNLSPGAERRWVVLRGHIVLVCDATVVNRYIEGNVQGDGTNVSLDLFESDAITASQTKKGGFGEYVVERDGTLGQGGQVLAVGIRPLILDALSELSIYIAAGVAGDSYSGYVDVLETIA